MAATPAVNPSPSQPSATWLGPVAALKSLRWQDWQADGFPLYTPSP